MNSVCIVLVVVAVLFVSPSYCDDLNLGTTVGAQLVFMDQVKLSAVPLTTRTKHVFYNAERNQLIKGINATDMDKSKGQATVMAGGVGFSFVNIRMKSQRGDGLNYQIQIFV